MAREITLGVVDIGERERAYVNDALDRRRLSPGGYVAAFEERFARAHGCRYAVACNSGTSALQVALAALKEVHGWADGDEVIVPALTFIATSNVVLYNDLVPRFVDVDARTFNIDPARIEAAVGPRTRAIIPVHLFGLPCDMEAIVRVARRHDLAILEDSCETMFARCHGRPVGSFGQLACFSTYVAHLLVTGVGGLIATDDEELALLCRSLIAHGRDTIYLNIDDDDGVTDNRLREIVARRFSFVRLGFSYRPTELEGALGLAQLERADEIIARRRQNARLLTDELALLHDRLQLPFVPGGHEHSFMMFPIVVRQAGERDALVNHLERHRVETRFMFPLLNAPVYRRLFGDVAQHWPVAHWLQQQGFYIGCHQGLTAEDIAWVGELFRAHYAERQLRATAENVGRVAALAGRLGGARLSPEDGR